MGWAMDITEGQEVVIVMSREDWAELRNRYQSAWYFMRDKVAMGNEPEGRVFGKTYLDTENGTAGLENRVSGLENRLTRNPGDDMAEPLENWIERQLTKLAAGLRELDRRVDDLETDEPARILERLDGLEKRAAVQDSVKRIERKLNAARQTEAFRAMYGGDPSPITQQDEMNQRYFMSGYEAGKKDAQEMSSPAESRDMVTDHAFRFTAPDRRHCSYRKNHRGSPCGRLVGQHTMGPRQTFSD